MSSQQVDRFLRIVDALPDTSQVGRLWFLVSSGTKKLYAVFTANTFTEIASAGGSGTVVDAETPTGTVDGSNLTFTLAHTPSPATSLVVYVAGIRKIVTTEYTLSGTTLTMDVGSTPNINDSFIVSYRY